MRQITEIVVHHSDTSKDLTLEKAVKSFNDNHYRRLYKPYKQPLSGVDGSDYIAYHILIDKDGKERRTRLDKKVGYHASNLDANNRSVGICLIGDFDTEPPTTAQLRTLERIIAEYKAKYSIEKVSGHRHYAKKSCPGNFFTDDMLEALSRDVEPPVPDDDREAIKWAKKTGIFNGERLNEPATRKEVAIMLYRLYNLPK